MDGRSPVRVGWMKAFRNPGTEYRGAPFWSWNDRLEDAELVRQIESMGRQAWAVSLCTPAPAC